MSFNVPFAPELFLTLAAGLLMLALAGWLLWLNVGGAVNRSLALFLLLRGALNINNYFADSPAHPAWATRAAPLFFIAVPFATAHFITRFRQQFSGRRASPALPWLLLVAAAGCEAAYLLAPSLFDYVAATGPFLFFYAAVWVLYAIAAFAIDRDARKAQEGRRRESLDLVVLGLALDPAFLSASCIVSLAAAPFDVHVYTSQGPATPWILTVFGVIALSWLFLLPVIARGLRGRKAASSRLILAAGATGVLCSVGSMLWGRDANALILLLDGVWTLSMPLLVGLAVLRYQLFGLDGPMRTTLRRGTLLSIAAGAAVVISQVLQNLLSSSLGALLGGLVAGAVVLSVTPLQRVADGVSKAAVPEARPVGQLSRQERAAIYRDQAVVAWGDGSVDRKERLLLSSLRDRLGLTHAEAEGIELSVSSQ